MQIQATIGGILYDPGGKSGSNHPDLELGNEFWNWSGTRFRLQITSWFLPDSDLNYIWAGLSHL